jgi:hypothetical protein
MNDVTSESDLSSYTGWTWYNYSNKKWANIVTIGNGAITYWVYIPRYAYMQIAGAESVDVRFITKSTNVTEELGEDWIVPDSFEFNGQTLDGYWFTKYEVQTATTTNSNVTVTITYNSINIKNKSTDTTSSYYIRLLDMSDTSTKYENTFGISNISSKGLTISSLLSDHTYKLTILKKDSSGIVTDVVYNNELQTQASPVDNASLSNIKIAKTDLEQFNNSCTYYVVYKKINGSIDLDNPEYLKFADVTYDENLKGKITYNDTTYIWYDYGSKIYANIATYGSETDMSTIEDMKKAGTWLVYIPRYAYKQISGAESVEAKFITTSITSANVTQELGSDWVVPDAFTFNSVELNGYWFSKYEVQTK